MECKFWEDYETETSQGELIDTLWNVNPTGAITFEEREELIDTLWNVNYVLTHYSCDNSGN